MSLVGLKPDWMRGYPHEFSGGQRQRIAIARALALKPKILFCDEPVSALDVSIQAQVINLLQDLQKELGLTIVFVSHDLSVVRHIANRIAVMYLGKLVETGTTQAIFNTPAHPYTSALLQAVPTIDTTWLENWQGDTTSEAAQESHPGCQYATRCPYADATCKKSTPTLKPLTKAESHQLACFHPQLSATMEPQS